MSTPTNTSVHAEAVRDIATVFRRHRLTYTQTKEVVKAARRRCRLTPPASAKGTVDRLTTEEQERFIEAAYKRGGKEGLMVQFLLETGLRVSEFVAVRVANVDLTERVVVVEHGKGGKRREVPITRDMARALRLYLGDRTSGYLFESTRHDRYSVRRVQQVVRAVAEAAGIAKRVHPHKLRHTMAKRLRDEGMPIDLLKEMLGHESVKTTEHYYGTSMARVRKAFDEAAVTRRKE